MILSKVNARHIRLISLYRMRYAVRDGGGLVFLMIALVFGLTVAQLVLTPVERVMALQGRAGGESDREQVVAEIVDVARPVIQWALDIESEEDPAGFSEPWPMSPGYDGTMTDPVSPAGDPWTMFLLNERPALLSIIFLILIFGMPLLIAFLAFNQLAGDVQSRGLRYLLLRTERGSIFLGRFLGAAVFSTLVMAAIIATITFYLGVKIRIYPAGPLILWALHGFGALAVLMLPYIALCSWISASVDSPFLSLVLSKLIIGGLLLFAFLASLAWNPAMYLKYALPWGLQNHLLHPELTHSLGTALACLAYTAVFGFLGYHRFETRDL